MALTTALPTSGNTAWYGYAEALHDAAGVGDGAIIVASNDAPAAVKEKAHYVCDGTADDVQINAAIEIASPTQANDAGMGGTDRAVAAGTQAGRVILTGGEFELSNSILIRTGVWLQGQGKLTALKPGSGLTASTGSGTPVAAIKNFDTYTHFTTISDLWMWTPSGSTFTGHAIYLESGSDLDSYPNTDPDTYAVIRDIGISNFDNSTSQNGVYIAGAPNGRGVFLDGLLIRNAGGSGIYIDAPDGAIQNCNIGGGQYSVRIEAGNFRVTNVKGWYADTAGFRFNNARTVATCIEAQDNAIGVQVAAGTQILEGVHVDNASSIGIDIASSVNTLKLSFLMHQRSGGRYATMTQGIDFNGGGVRQNVQGVIDATDITTPVAGTTAGSGNFMRISHGTTLVSVG
jgi:hypothetical protein